MKLHIGPVANPTTVITDVNGYTFQGDDGTEEFYERPAKISRRVRKLFGVSAGGWFFGVMLWHTPQST